MLIPAIVDYFKYKIVASIIVLTCEWSAKDAVKLTRQLSKHGASATVTCDPSVLDRVSHHGLQGVLFVDQQNHGLIEKIHPEYFSVRYKWLIVTESLPNFGKLRYDADIAWIKLQEKSEIFRAFSFVKALKNQPNIQKEPVSINDIYCHPRDGLSTHTWAIWSQGPGLQLLKDRERIMRRQNLAQYPLKVVSPVGVYSREWFDGSFTDYLRDERLPERDSGIRVGYRASSLIVEMLNASEELLQTNLWVDLDTNSSVIRMVSSDTAQLSGAIIRLLPKRLKYIDYVTPLWPFSVGFTYLAERESSSNMFVAPFSAEVWWCCLALGFVLALAQRATSRLPGEREAAYISVLATWLQQDASAVPKNLSARWSFVCLSVASMLVHAYYTSAIVSALVGSGFGGPATLKALADSKYAMASEDYEYMNYTFFGVNTGWDELEYLKKKKMTSNLYQDIETGVKLIREGKTAYHAEYNRIYPYLGSFSDEHACKLKYIDTIPETLTWIAMVKRSEWSNVFKTKGDWLQETGIAPLIVSRFLIRPPPCRASLLAERVKFGDIAPLLSVTVFGVLLSLMVLGVEIMVVRFRKKKEGQILDEEVVGVEIE